MRPTSSELLDAIARELELRVLPVVEDKWAASTLRSAMQLLRHLALRVELEPRMLAEDSEDARRSLAGVQNALAALDGTTDPTDRAVLAALRDRVAMALAAEPADALDVRVGDARNEQYLEAIEALIGARDRLRAAGDEDVIHRHLVAYLERRLGRERALYLPVFLSPPF